MRSIEARFREKKSKDRNDVYGAYIHLAEAVKGQKFSRKSLVKAFKKLMPFEEYSAIETSGLVSHLEYLTNIAVEVENSIQIAFSDLVNSNCDTFSVQEKQNA